MGRCGLVGAQLLMFCVLPGTKAVLRPTFAAIADTGGGACSGPPLSPEDSSQPLPVSIVNLPTLALPNWIAWVRPPV